MTSPLEQKKLRITGPSIVTANRTADGAVIYRTDAKNWSIELSQAAIVRDVDAARSLWAEAIADDVGAIGSYIAPVEVSADGVITPGNFREMIRHRGVTIDLPLAVL